MPDIHDVPCPKHPRTRVIRKGVRTRSGKTYQRFQCQSVSGKHTFLAEIPASGGQQEQEQQQAEKQKHKEQLAEVSCAEHPGSKVTRRGFIIMGLLESLKLNQSRGVAISRLCEIGRIFIERNGRIDVTVELDSEVRTVDVPARAGIQSFNAKWRARRRGDRIRVRARET